MGFHTPLVAAILVVLFGFVLGASIPVQTPAAAAVVSEVDVPVDAGPVIIVLEQQEQNQVEPVQDSPSFEAVSGEPEDFVEGQPPLGVSDVPGEKKPAPKPAAPGKPASKPAAPAKPAPKPQKPAPGKPAAGKPQKPAVGKPQPPKPQKPVGKPQKPAGKPQQKPQKPAVKPEKPGPNRPQRPTPKPQRPSGKPNRPGKPNKIAGEEVEEFDIDNSTTFGPVEYDYDVTTPVVQDVEVVPSVESVAEVQVES